MVVVVAAAAMAGLKGISNELKGGRGSKKPLVYHE